MAKGFWRHGTRAMWIGAGKDLGVPPRDPALVVAAPGAVVLDVKRYVCVSKASRRRWERNRREVDPGEAGFETAENTHFTHQTAT